MTDLRVPAQAQPFVSVLGVEGAIAFLLEFGGAEIYIARTPQGRGRVEAAIGRDAAARLAACEGLPRRIPLCKPWVARMLRSQGWPGENTPLPVAEIARRMHASEVSVRKWLKGHVGSQPDPRQPTLFD